MAHKGYTLNYFINFFKSIPDHRWTEGTEQRVLESGENTVQKCAIGHVTSDNRLPANSEVRTASTDRLEALARIFGSEDNIASVNDGELEVKGSTPRGRILKALRNKQRTGNIEGKTETEMTIDPNDSADAL